MSGKHEDEYGLGTIRDSSEFPAPDLPYRPQKTKSYNPPIGLIGCGGISEHQLTAYKNGGYNIVALCDVVRDKAEKRRDEFFPDALVSSDFREILEHREIEVVDITPHPPERVPIVEDAICAGKHVLSQKPFVEDIERGKHLAGLAQDKGVTLAVNQNGRWAPHFSYIRHAIAAGMIGDVIGAHLSVHWNHNWIATTEFNNVHHIVLYDFGIHWFDIVTCFMGGRPAKRVYASIASSPSQEAKPPLMGQSLIEYDNAQATLSFDADAKFGAQDRTYIVGTKGSIISVGPDLMDQTVTIFNESGHCIPKLEGTWFPDGLQGAMAELLCSIEDQRAPFNNAENNLRSLELCFAAIASADSGEPKVPGTVSTISA